MEVQIAKLLGLMEAQQQRQEELAGEQRGRQEALAEEQRQFAGDLAQQQREQLERLAEDHQRQFEELARRQTVVEGQAGVLEDQLATAEATLVELATTQKALEEDLRTERRSGVGDSGFLGAREKPVKEDPTRTEATTGLDASAPEFVPWCPSRSTSGGGGDGADRSREAASAIGGLQRPPPYDGRTSWEAYRSQFEMLATLGRWSEPQKATYLAVSLRGTALTVLSNMPQERRTSYSALAVALQNRFGTAHQAELHRATLRNRGRRREESLPEPMEDIERLVRLAYPQAEPTMLEVLAKDHFIDALADEDMRLRLRQARPESLQQALETALELESYRLASRDRSRSVRAAKLSSGSEKPSRAPSAELLETLQRCVKAAIAGFATIADPLHSLLHVNRSWEWTSEAQRAFQHLRQALVEAPALRYPLPEGRLVLDTDASNDAVGAVLSQEQEGRERVVAYYSQSHKRPERNYCATHARNYWPS